MQAIAPTGVPVVGGEDGPAWLYREPDARDAAKSEWRAFRQKDQQQLEHGQSELVLVEGGRFEVRRQDRMLVDRYSAVPPVEPREVRRCLWQRQVTTSSWEPFDEPNGCLIEEAYQVLLQTAQAVGIPSVGEEISETVTLSSENRVIRLRLKGGDKENLNKWILIGDDCPSNTLLSLMTSVKLKRGYKAFALMDGEAEEEVLGDRVDRLFILVHGIGEKMWKKDGTGIRVRAATLRRNLQRQQLLAAGFKESGDGKSWQYPKQSEKEDTSSPAIIPISCESVFSEGTVYKTGNEADKAWDGDSKTFFDVHDEGFTAVELPRPSIIAEIRFVPRSGYATRMVGGHFQGSNDKSSWTTLHEVVAVPSDSWAYASYTVAKVTDQCAYRYVRYRGGTESHCNVANIALYGKQVDNLDSVIPKHEVLTASWEHSVHCDEVDERLNSITLPSQQTVRQIANHVVLDVIYFSQMRYKKIIVKTASDVIDGLVARFRQYHPHFQGNIYLVAHSLGGVILFELLRHGVDYGAQLPFTPSGLFTLGSPTGMFMHSGDDVPSLDFTLPGGTRFFNIFHPLDPIAYRIEPLLAPSYAEVIPEEIPAEGYWGGQRMHQRLRGIMSWASGRSKTMEEMVQSTKIALNAHQRIDWVLQNHMNVIGEAGELLQAAASHTGYLDNVDVAAFINARSDIIDSETLGASASQNAGTAGDAGTKGNASETASLQDESGRTAGDADTKGNAPETPSLQDESGRTAGDADTKGNTPETASLQDDSGRHCDAKRV